MVEKTSSQTCWQKCYNNHDLILEIYKEHERTQLEEYSIEQR